MRASRNWSGFLKRVTNWAERDRLTGLHEAGHATAVVMFGGNVEEIIGHRHLVVDEASSGFTCYSTTGLTAREVAFVALAGIAAANDVDVLVDGDTADERVAKSLVGRDELPHLRYAVLAWRWRRDISSAIDALAKSLGEHPRRDGTIAREVVFGAMDRVKQTAMLASFGAPVVEASEPGSSRRPGPAPTAKPGLLCEP
jgi:hypothetical protein